LRGAAAGELARARGFVVRPTVFESTNRNPGMSFVEMAMEEQPEMEMMEGPANATSATAIPS